MIFNILKNNQLSLGLLTPDFYLKYLYHYRESKCES